MKLALSMSIVGIVSSAIGCGSPPGALPHPSDSLHFPTHLTLSLDGRYLHVMNSNFDLRYQTGALNTIALDTHEFVAKGHLPVPSFSGKLILTDNPDGSTYGYFPNREEGELWWMKNDVEAESIFTCGQTSAESKTLCTEAFRTSTGTVGDELIRMELDPYAIGYRPSAIGGKDLILTGGLLDPRFSVWEIESGGTPILRDQKQIANGLSGIANHPITSQVYVSAQYTQAVYPIGFTDPSPITGTSDQGVEISDISLIPLPNESYLGRPIYGQDITFNDKGTLAFVAYRYPSSVAVIDVAPTPSGKPANTPIAFIEVGGNPTSVVHVADETGGMLYVSSSSTGSVYVFEVPSLELVDTLSVGRGASSMVASSNPTLGTSKLYISLFEEAGVAVVDINPESPWYHQRTATIR